MLTHVIKPVSFFLMISFALLDFSVTTAQARMVDTSEVIAAQQQQVNRERIAAFLNREDVQQIMTRQGVDPAEAQQRLNSLSDEELAKIADSMDRLPAGGSTIGTLVGAAVFIFIVLLITDILGFTHVFSFVNHQR
jgi:hypothetical protein